MALNFMDDRFVQLECDKVCADNYDITNLLKPANKITGSVEPFMVEHFISPPVCVHAKFTTYPIDIYAIEIGLEVRSHRVSSIIVSTSPLLDGHTRKEEVVKLFNIAESSVVAFNGSYSQNYALRTAGFRIENVSADGTSKRKFMIGRRFSRALMDVRCLTVKIVSTACRSVPCLSYLRIYGKPSRMKHEAILAFCQKYFPDMKPTLSQTDSLSASVSVESKDEPSAAKKYSRAELERIAPIEFMDALTDELMADPYTLPSGKNIDKKSLDKYLESFNDSSLFCDPFTRLPFDAKSCPKANDDLRKRIQEFHESNGDSELKRESERRKRLFDGMA